MSATVADVCLVVVVTPHRTLEIALPASVPLCDLMPALVQRATTFGAPNGRPAGGEA